jgi:hypothetical protein
MSAPTPPALRMLAEAWRSKAARLEKTYARQSPNLVLHCKTALETCAEDLEQLLGAPTQPPGTPALQNSNSPTPNPS